MSKGATGGGATASRGGTSAGGISGGGRAGSGGGGGGGGAKSSGGATGGGSSSSGGRPATGGSGGSMGGAQAGSINSGGAAGKSMGGAGSGGISTGGTRSGGGGSAGAGGSGCANQCDANADCVPAGSCACRPGYIGNGRSCARPISCDELHRAQPTLPSGAYTLKPSDSSAEFTAYCEMSAEGGGWTLLFNQGTGFRPAAAGALSTLCYENNCVSRAYSTVLVRSDVMLDMSDSPISGDDYLVRAVITQVQTATRGNTVRDMVRSGPYYLERDDNSNLQLRFRQSGDCAEFLPEDMARLLCDGCGDGESCEAPVLVLGDEAACSENEGVVFAIGGALSHAESWSNCAGWPQAPNFADRDYYPDYFRFWVR